MTHLYKCLDVYISENLGYIRNEYKCGISKNEQVFLYPFEKSIFSLTLIYCDASTALGLSVS